jgi:hypothetical protein
MSKREKKKKHRGRGREPIVIYIGGQKSLSDKETLFLVMLIYTLTWATLGHRKQIKNVYNMVPWFSFFS